jgi:DNA-binding MarR family transcriptional regulator
VSEPGAYQLEDQVGFILRQAAQRHAVIFATLMANDLTATQWAALSKLHEVGPTSQNLLGRLTAMDVATIKGVVDRLMKRGFVRATPDKDDARRRLLVVTEAGRAFVDAHFTAAHAITTETLAPLNEDEQAMFLALLKRLR